MKNLLLVFTALLAISGIVSAILWGDLRTERQTNAELRSQLAMSGIVSRAPATSATPAAPAQPVATTPPAAVPEAPIAAAKPAPPALESEVFMRATTAAITAGARPLTGGIVDERDLMNDPEYRKAQLTQARLRLAQSNPGLAEALGISRREADHLFEVMAETQLKLTDEFTEMVTKAAGATPSIAAMMEKASGRQDPARTVLGEARYAQYQEYQRNAKPALTKVASMGYNLKYASQPLNDSQSRAVAAAVLAEQQRQRQEAEAAPRPNPNPGVPRNAADTLAEYRKTEDESSRRILAAVSPHLNSAQIDVLQKEIEQQAAFARRTDARLQALPQPASPPTRAP
jgi:hypothetical protein